MSTTEIPLYDWQSGSQGLTRDARARTVISCRNQDGYIRKGAPASHRVEVRTLLPGSVMFRVNSSVEQGVQYQHSPPEAWPVTIRANPQRNGFRRASWTPRSAGVEHVGECPTGNSHTVSISVKVMPIVEGEQVDIGSDGEFFYEVSCEC